MHQSWEKSGPTIAPKPDFQAFLLKYDILDEHGEGNGNPWSPSTIPTNRQSQNVESADLKLSCLGFLWAEIKGEYQNFWLYSQLSFFQFRQYSSACTMTNGVSGLDTLYTQVDLETNRVLFHRK